MTPRETPADKVLALVEASPGRTARDYARELGWPVDYAFMQLWNLEVQHIIEAHDGPTKDPHDATWTLPQEGWAA